MKINSKILYFLFLFLFVLGQLQRIELGSLPPFYLHDIVLFLWLLMILVTKKTRIIFLLKKNKLKNFKFEILLLSWIVIGWLVSFIMGELGVKFIFYSFRFSTYSLLFILINKINIVKQNYLKIGFYLAGFSALLLGLLQYAFLPDMRFLSILGWDDHLHRLIGTQFDPNFMGMIFVLLFVNFNKIKLKWSDFKYSLWFKRFFLFLILVGLSLTFSRSSYLSFIVVLLLTAKFNFRKYLSGLVLITLIIFIPKPGGEGVDLTRMASVNARIESSQSSVNSLKPYQYVVGQGLFNKSKPSYAEEIFNRADHALLEDNFILLIFNSTGIVGLSLVSFLFVKHLLLMYKKDQTGVISILAVMTHAMFNNSIFQPFVFIYLAWSLVRKIDR